LKREESRSESPGPTIELRCRLPSTFDGLGNAKHSQVQSVWVSREEIAQRVEYEDAIGVGAGKHVVQHALEHHAEMQAVFAADPSDVVISLD
jgi:hypothetical protein